MTGDKTSGRLRRRDLVRRLAAGTLAGGGLAATATGSAVAASDVRLRWEFDDGHAEEMTLAEFEQRSDTPSRAALRERGTSVWASVCCSCPLRMEECEECPDGCGGSLETA